MTIAAMSQYAQTQGMSSSSAMVTAMMNDASDGVMDGNDVRQRRDDGRHGHEHVAAAQRPAPAAWPRRCPTFMASAQNHSGVSGSNNAGMQNLMTQLNGSDGQMMSGGPPPRRQGERQGVQRRDEPGDGHGLRGHRWQPGCADRQHRHGLVGRILDVARDLRGAHDAAVTGGTFADEATGTTMSMGSSNVMTAAMSSIQNGAQVSGICITALTSMAQTHAVGMSGGMTDANITAANTAVGNYFMMSNILTTQPIDMTMAGSGRRGVTQDQMNHGAAIAAMSQSAKRLGMTTTSSAFVTSMMNDASDGTMNGMMGSSQISMGGGMMGGSMMGSHAGTSDLATDMTNFMGSAMNHSGLTSANMNALIQKLSSSNGTL